MDEQHHILVVDDDTDLCEVLADKLTSEGFRVSVAHNGADGLAKALDLKPDLVLLDVMMPDMSGHQVLAKLREDAWGKDANVTLLTNVGDLNSISSAVRGGTREYLVKTDWSLPEVVEHVRTRLTAE